EGFMRLGENMKADYALAQRQKEGRRGRRWSVGVGMTAGAIGIVGIVVCGRFMLNLK
uniref:Uncharacterized protein n=1 Tax=Caenorhabditis japonica TaxID=281687 RepID=A0A8R1EAA7_CAEJA